jgi:hypothetical protein
MPAFNARDDRKPADAGFFVRFCDYRLSCPLPLCTENSHLAAEGKPGAGKSSASDFAVTASKAVAAVVVIGDVV